MSRELIWTPAARRHLEEIWQYIARQDEAAARTLIERVRVACSRLADFPEISRSGRVAGTRELVITGTPYIVPYRVQDGRVEIIAVFHGSRQWPVAF